MPITPPAPLALTVGEPAGIGPDIALGVAALDGADLALVGDIEVLRTRAAPGLELIAANAPPRPGCVRVAHVPLAAPCVPGQPDARNSAGVLAMLYHAVDGWRAGHYRGLVTAPVDKGVLRRAGHDFTGHTEYLAQRCGTGAPVMLLAGGTLRVALVTTHLPLRAVPDAITGAGIMHTVRTLDQALRDWFDIARPRIGVLGLNPHAGEGGTLGREDADIIAPAIAALRAQRLDVHGPLAADTVFTPAQARTFDALVAMYHDQGLPALKQASFGHAVNVTLGLPLVRTSVDHGVAYDAAGTDRADPASLRAALALARRLTAPR